MATFVTKSFLPEFSEYERYLQEIWQRGVLTNQGPCVRELEQKMREFLDVENFHYLTNGTIALQLALNTLGITDGEIITTPFSYVATISSILWERCKPVFVDIEPDNFTIDADKIETRLTPNTKAIMAVHVFGYPCNVEKIAMIAAEHNLKVIYDGAHAFGAKYKGKSLLDYGDVSTCSFHATKLFHTIEGGACIVKDKSVSDKLELAKRFGHNYDDHRQLGINAKASEFHAAMGLANFPHIGEIIADRKRVSDTYDIALGDCVCRPTPVTEHEYNYAYYPVVFKNEEELERVFSVLAEHQIYPRRYFYPSLNTIKYVSGEKCPVAEDISSRIACLPLFAGLENFIVEQIANKLKRELRNESIGTIDRKAKS
jgi:dTDP-4-amino-4,6-dideoxygalactose transaminase